MSIFDSGSKAAKFETIGQSITGRISAAPKEVQQTEFGTDRPAVWPSGDPKMQILVTLDTTLRDDNDDDGARTLYVASPRMRKAIAQAIREAGATDVTVGGTLTVTFTGYDPASKNQQQPAKTYSATYQPPASGLAQPAAPAPTPAATPAPQPAVAALTPEQVAIRDKLRAAAVPEPNIAAALGVPLTALN